MVYLDPATRVGFEFQRLRSKTAAIFLRNIWPTQRCRDVGVPVCDSLPSRFAVRCHPICLPVRVENQQSVRAFQPIRHVYVCFDLRAIYPHVFVRWHSSARSVTLGSSELPSISYSSYMTIYISCITVGWASLGSRCCDGCYRRVANFPPSY